MKYTPLFALLSLAIATPALGASYGDGIMMLGGSGAPLANGDFVSQNTGLNSTWRWFVEVPPGTAQVAIDVFDADLSGANEFIQGASDTSITYRVIDPSGATVQNITLGPNACAGCNGIFARLFTQNLPANGHWTVELDLSTTVTTGDDFNGLGLRASDGDFTPGGTELNVYTDSHAPLSYLGTSERDRQVFPYVTGSCTIRVSDFDYDDDAQPAGTITLTPRTGTPVFTTANLSGNALWELRNFGNYNDNQNAVNYGIWNFQFAMDDLGAGFSGNFGHFWFGTQAHSTTAQPTAQPEPDTWRVYFGQDPAVAGGQGPAPLKPYLEHRARYSSGANPPAVGQLTRVVITQRVVNPTPHDINVLRVTSTVPSSGGQNTFVQVQPGFPSAGSATSPAAGATGNIQWVPGTVAANSSEIFAYAVDVTPTGATPVVVTGQNGANGTRMVFVDETANTAQARATYDTQSLCRLRLPVALAAYAPVHDARAHLFEGGVQVVFESDAESATQSFDIVRERENTRTLLARLAPKSRGQGARYAFVDEMGRAGDTYDIIERDQNEVSHARAKTKVSLDDVEQVEGAMTFALAKGIFQKRSLQDFRAQAKNFEGEVARVLLRSKTKGMVRVPYERLAQAFEREVDEIQEAAEAAMLSLKTNTFMTSAKEVRYLADADALYFYNAFERTQFNNEGVVSITFAEGAPMQTLASGESEDTPVHALQVSERLEQDLVLAPNVQRERDGEVLFWAGIGTYAGARDTFDIPLVVLGQSAERTNAITIEGIGASKGRNRTEVYINEQYIGAFESEGFEGFEARFELPTDAFDAGARLSLRSARSEEDEQSAVFIDALTLEYQALPVTSVRRSFKGHAAQNTRLTFAENTHVFDTTSIDDVRLMTSNTQTYSVRAASDIESVIDERVDDLRFEQRPLIVLQPEAREYTIISPRAFAPTLERLRQHRAAELNVSLIALEDLYDLYSGGKRSPLAIRAFLAESEANGALPHYLLLVGKVTLDPRQALEMHDEHLPILLERGDYGLFASDARLADVDDDGALDIALGRLPVTDAASLETMIDKIIARENTPSTSPHALVAADADDAAFRDVSQNIVQAFAPKVSVEVHEDDTLDLDFAQEAFSSNVDAVVYVGHGSMSKLSGRSEGFSLEDVDALNESVTQPVVAAFSCLTGRSEVPGLTSLAEALLFKERSGALAFVAPSGVSDLRMSAPLALRFSRAIFAPGTGRLGDRFLDSMSDEDGVFQLLGDPAQKLPTLAEVHEPSGGQEQSPNAVVYERRANGGVLTIEELIAQDEVPAFETPAPTPERPQPFSCQKSSSAPALTFLMLALVLQRKRRSF